MNISGKRAVVFGGTSGIGLATTLMLADGGATVTAISRNPSKSGPMPANVTTQSCDVLDGASVEALLNDLAPIDILVSAATGGGRAIGPFLEMDMGGFKGSFDKLWGYANVVRYGARHVTDGGSITLVSGAPARNCRPGQIALSSVGSAVEAMVRAAALRYKASASTAIWCPPPSPESTGNWRASSLHRLSIVRIRRRLGCSSKFQSRMLSFFKTANASLRLTCSWG